MTRLILAGATLALALAACEHRPPPPPSVPASALYRVVNCPTVEPCR